MTERDFPDDDQLALSRAGDLLGQLLSQAGDYWERDDEVPPDLWIRIAEVAADVSAHARALAGRESH